MKKFIYISLMLIFTINVNSQVLQTWNWSANQGQSADFEKAVSDKTKKYNSSKDGALLYTFQINSGNEVGSYWRIRIEDELKDFDKQYPNGLKAMADNAAKYGSVTSSAWWNIVENATFWPEGDNNWKKPLKRYFVYNYIPPG